MGGLNSEIEDDTTKVLIESAYFNPVTVRKAAKLTSIGTDASHRFERGIDPEGTIVALERAAQLITQLGEGQLVKGIIDERPKMIQNTPIAFTAAMINRRLGTELSADEMIAMLGTVGFDVDKDGENLMTVPPSFRVDLSRPADISEEIARLWGYNNIKTTYAKIPSLKRDQDPRIMTRNSLKRLLAGLGMSEAINYSFINENSCDKLRLTENDPRRNTATILNPLSEDLSVLRSSLIPGLLDTMRRNNSRQVYDLAMFECGKAFIGSAQNTQSAETEYLAGFFTGNSSEKSWDGAEKSCDFF